MNYLSTTTKPVLDRAIEEVAPPHSFDRLTYEVLDDIRSIAAIESDWDALLDRSDCNRAFSSAAWFIAACRVNPSNQPGVIVAREGSSIAGILPLILNIDGTEALSLAYLNDYGDVIAAKNQTDVAMRLIEWALRSGSGYRRLCLRRMRDDSLILAALKALGFNSSNLVGERQEGCSYINLAAGYEAYLASRGRRLRRNLSYCHRRAAALGVSSVELEPGSIEAAALADIFLQLNFERFGLKSGFQSEREQAFIRAILPILFSRRRMRAFGLVKDRNIVAIDLCMVGPNSLCLWNGGFKAEVEEISPGKLLLEAEIRAALAMNMDELDLLRGPQPWKSQWLTGQRTVFSCEIATKAVATKNVAQDGIL